MALFLKRFLVGHVQKLVELMIFFFKMWLRLFVTAGFVYSWWRSTVTDGVVYTDTPHTLFFSCTMRMHNDVYCTTLAQVSARAHHVISMVIHNERLIDRLFFLFLALFLSVCLSFTLLFSSHFNLYSVLNLFLRQTYPPSPAIEESCSLAEFTPPTGVAPSLDSLALIVL